jgi:hypothetical protein
LEPETFLDREAISKLYDVQALTVRVKTIEPRVAS